MGERWGVWEVGQRGGKRYPWRRNTISGPAVGGGGRREGWKQQKQFPLFPSSVFKQFITWDGVWCMPVQNKRSLFSSLYYRKRGVSVRCTEPTNISLFTRPYCARNVCGFSASFTPPRPGSPWGVFNYTVTTTALSPVTRGPRRIRTLLMVVSVVYFYAKRDETAGHWSTANTTISRVVKLLRRRRFR